MKISGGASRSGSTSGSSRSPKPRSAVALVLALSAALCAAAPASPWLRYRAAECSADARAYLGGTLAAIVFGRCELTLTKSRIKEVAAMVGDYCTGRAGTGPYRRCP